MTVIHSFTPSIISSPTLSEIQAKNIVAFMMDCQHKVFKVPEGVKVTALGRIHRIKNGQSDLCRGKILSHVAGVVNNTTLVTVQYALNDCKSQA